MANQTKVDHVRLVQSWLTTTQGKRATRIYPTMLIQLQLLLIGSGLTLAGNLTAKHAFDMMIRKLETNKLQFGDPTTFEDLKSAMSGFCREDELLLSSKNYSELFNSIMEETLAVKETYCLDRLLNVLRYSDVDHEISLEIPAISHSVPLNIKLITQEIVNNLDFDYEVFDPEETNIIARLLTSGYSFQLDKPSKKKGLQERINVKMLALNLGDSTITSEVDLSGAPLEGGDCRSVGSFLVRATQMAASFLPLTKFDEVQELHKFASKIEEGIGYREGLKKLRGLKDGYDNWELLIIDTLRKLKVGDDILVPITFTGHALAFSVKKTGPRTYELNLFNSGAGSDYHGYVDSGSDRKYFPSKRYVNISLADFKTLRFFRKMAELIILSGLVATTVEGDPQGVYNAKDLYENILASLNDFEYSYTAEDIKILHLISTQRSGTCNFRGFMVYLAFMYPEKFRHYKLLINKAIILAAAGKTDWKDHDKPVVSRLLKFAIENQSRSVAKMIKRNELQGLNPDNYFGQTFEKIYRGVDKMLGISRPTEFKIDLKSFQHDMALLNTLIERGKNVKRSFDEFKNGTVKNLDTETRSDSMNLAMIHSETSANNFGQQLSSLLELVERSSVWSKMGSVTHKLTFVCDFVLSKVPVPQKETDIWNQVFEANEAMVEMTLKKIFKLVQFILRTQLEMKTVYPAAYVSVMKLFAITHKALMMIAPEMSSCNPMLTDFATMQESGKWYLFLDANIHSQLATIIEFFTDGKGKDQPKCQEPGSWGPLHKYLFQYAGGISTDLATTDIQRVNVVYSRRYKKEIPPHHYYWRDLSIIWSLMGNFDVCTIGVVLADEYDIYDGCTFDRGYPICSAAQTQRTEFCPELDSWDFRENLPRLIGKPSVKGPSKHRDFRGRPNDYFMKHFGLTSKSENLLFHLFYTKMYCFDRFETIYTEGKDDFDWSSLVYFGIHSIAQNIRTSDPSLASRTHLMVSTLKDRIKKLEKNNAAMSKQIPASEASLRDIKYLSGLLVLTSFMARKAGDQNLETAVIGELEKFVKTCTFEEMHASHMIHAAFGFIFAASNLDLVGEYKTLILKTYYLITEHSDILESGIDRKYFVFSAQMISARAYELFVLRHRSHEELKSILPASLQNLGIVDVKLPYVMLENGIKFNLYTGAAQLNGVRSTRIQDEELESLFSIAGYDKSQMRFSSSSEVSISGTSLVTCKVDDLSRPSIQIPSLTGKCELLGVELLRYDNDVKIMKSLSGDIELHGVKIGIEEWNQLPIPAAEDKDTRYEVYCEPRSNSIFFETKTRSFWFTAGVFNFGISLPNLVPLSSSTENSFLSPLTSSEHFAVFRGELAHYALFKYYSDQSGQPLGIRKMDNQQSWCLLSEEKFCVLPNQNIVNAGYIQNYLAVGNNEGLRKIVIPIEYYKVRIAEPKIEEPRSALGGSFQFKFSDENFDTLKSTRMISLSSDFKPNPMSRIESILLAYKYLVGRDYYDSFSMIRRVHQMEPFSDEELRLMGWILFSNSAVRDGSPESVSIRSYAVYLVFQNKQLFNTFPIAKNSNEDAEEKKVIDPYEIVDRWKIFWKQELRGEMALKTVNSYFARRSKIPINLRFDHKTGRDFLSAFEERTWLEWLNTKSHSDDIGLYLYPRRVSRYEIGKTLPRSESIPAITEQDLYDLRRQRHSRLKFNLTDITLFKPKFVKSGFYQVMHKLIYSKYSDITAENLKEYFMTWKNTTLHDHGKLLYNAIRLNRSEIQSELPREISTQCYAIHKQAECMKMYQELIETLSQDIDGYEFVISTKPKFTQPKEKKTKKFTPVVIETALRTKSFAAPKLLKWNNLDEIKETMLKSIDTIPQHLWDDLSSSRKGWKSAQKQVLLGIMKIVSGDALDNDSSYLKKLKRIGKGSIKLSKIDILHSYAHASSKRYFQFCPDVPATKHQELHDLCTEYAVWTAYLNDIKRLLAARKDMSTLRTELADRRVFSSSTDNIIVAYEAFINSRLTKEQVEDIKELTTKYNGRYPNMVIQRMMSAGKTFILGTILAFMKADKKTLSILVIPRALFSSEASSLISRTINAFGSEGFSFSVSRECSSESFDGLIWIYNAIKRAREEGRYLIINPETLLTLQNKLTESVISKSKERENEFKVLQGILSILKDHGSAVFDEIDTTFDPTQDLNFPLEASSQQDALIDQGLFMAEIFADLVLPEVRAIVNVSTNVIIDDSSYTNVRRILVDSLVQKITGKKSFNLSALNQKHLRLKSEITSADIVEFFDIGFLDQSNSENHAGNLISSITGDYYTTAILAVCRMTLNEFLKIAWTGNVNENYGISPSVLYAIPYASAGTPKSGSEFSFRWFTYVRTIRMYMVVGLDMKRLKEVIRWLKNWADKELDEEVSLEQSRAAQISFTLFGKSPFALNPDIEEELKRYQLSMQTRTDSPEYVEILMSWIAEVVIPSVTFYDQQISSNAADFEMMLNSVQGYTGTIATVKILPSCFHAPGSIKLQAHIEEDIKNKLLADRTYENLDLPKMWEVIKVPTSCKASTLWTDLRGSIAKLETRGYPFSAVIDVGAYFKDETNEDVAHSLINIKPAALYFSSTMNKLALVTPQEQEKIIHTISRSSLEDLGIKPEERVTFYDQQHTTGVDIFQHDEGFAFLIIGMKTSTRDFNQAVMRMRKFLKTGKSQKIVALVPENVANLISPIEVPISLKNILEFLRLNMKERVKLHNSVALNNILRAHYKEPIYQKFLNAAKYEDVKCLAENIWVRSTEMPITKQILPNIPQEYETYIRGRIDDYEDAVKSCLDQGTLQNLRASGTEKINVALQGSMEYYPKTVNTKTASDSDQVVENVSENKLEVEAQVEVEVDNQTNGSSVFQNALPVDFKAKEFPEIYFGDIYGRKPVLGFLNLNQAFADAGFSLLNGLFDDRIYVSSGFLRHFFGRNRRYIFHLLWMTKENDTRVAIIDENEVIQWNMTSARFTYGYDTVLMTPLGNISKDFGTKPIIDDALLASAMIYGGFTNVFNNDRWYKYMKSWLGEGEQKVVRSMIYRKIITDKMEAPSYKKSRLSALLEVPEADEQKVFQSSDYQMLNIISSNSSAVDLHFDQLLADVSDEKIPDIVGMALIDMNFHVSNDSKITISGFKLGMKALKEALEKGNNFDSEILRKLKMISKHIFHCMPFAWMAHTDAAIIAFDTFKSIELSDNQELKSDVTEIFEDLLKANSYVMTFDLRHSNMDELFMKRELNIEVVSWMIETRYVNRHPEVLVEVPVLFGWSTFPSFNFKDTLNYELGDSIPLAAKLLEVVKGTPLEEQILIQQLKLSVEIVTSQTIFSDILKKRELDPSDELKAALIGTLKRILEYTCIGNPKVVKYLEKNGYLSRWPWLDPAVFLPSP